MRQQASVADAAGLDVFGVGERHREDFATLDLISHGRAEFTAGHGAYLESFPLLDQDL